MQMLCSRSSCVMTIEKQVTHVRLVVPHSVLEFAVTKQDRGTERKGVMNYENIKKGKQELNFLFKRAA